MFRLFSKKDNEISCRTQVNFCGIKFQYLNKNLIKQPDYTNALNKIKEKIANNKKIKVGFLVNEIAKWNAQELYNLLENSTEFEPYILVTVSTDVHSGKDKQKDSFKEICDYFRNQGNRIIEAYDADNHDYIDINSLDIDILFYQQPWYLSAKQDPYIVSKSAVCCYFPYGLLIFDSPVDNKPFHEKLYYYFVSNTLAKEQIKKYKFTDLDNMIPIGFPKVDIYKKLKIEQHTKTIIYAPHFGYAKNQAIRVGTFPWSGEKMLEFAKVHSEFNWIFKPHPNLKYTLAKDRKFGETFADSYYKEWSEIGIISEDSNYFELFAKSDLLITDSCSFMLEYMPTEKPIIRLDRADATKLSRLGDKLLEGVYRVFDFKSFEEIFEELIFKNNDNLKDKRKDITKNIIFEYENPNQLILESLKKLL